jgi:hypothetical protein
MHWPALLAEQSRRRAVVGVFFLIFAGLFGAQVLADINHLSKVDNKLSSLHLKRTITALEPDRCSPIGLGDEELQLLCKQVAQLTRKASGEISDFMTEAYQDERSFSITRMPIDFVWAAALFCASLLSLGGWRLWRRGAQTMAGVGLLCAACAGLVVLITGTSDGYVNLLVWPLGVTSLFLHRTITSIGDAVWWPIAAMTLWGGVVFFIIYASKTQPEERLSRGPSGEGERQTWRLFSQSTPQASPTQRSRLSGRANNPPEPPKIPNDSKGSYQPSRLSTRDKQ